MRPIVLVLLVACGCSVDRPAPESSGGAHPVGWADKSDPAFHGAWLKANKFPLASRCAQCHGADFAGGAVSVTCSGSSCHTRAPTECTTCHGSNGTPRPATGAHAAHQPFCDTCHQVPVETGQDVERHASGDVSTLIHFAGLAIQGMQPAWDRSAQRCTNVGCHFGAPTPLWSDPSQIPCNGCHQAPPSSHARWSRLANTPASCASCHPTPSDPRHGNGIVDVTVSDCTTCHGSNGHPNPPTALDGSTDPTTRGVGAHARHLDGSLSDRISRPLACATCHTVPASVSEPGHLDSAQTKVRFPFGGAYDAASATCNVWCHFDRAPGPTWTDASGGARRCDACHAFPPVRTRAGTPHPSVAANVDVCRECHVFDPSTHVNGVVDFH